eukprot:TRINITY_DN10555_c0_g3_i2.p1 TRINITY_DN10555_c0_g3~~TRINITY_DN10555_c0_g3_i2.p1  ORF type:complete len:435 (+),score=133.81 TRINITY_DN10555_c0_g3_i2:54-1358(+)
MTALPEIQSQGRSSAVAGETRSQSAMAGPPPKAVPQPVRSETSLGHHVDGGAPVVTGMPWLDDMHKELQAEAREAHRAGTQAGMHSGFATKFEIPTAAPASTSPPPASSGVLVPSHARPAEVKRKGQPAQLGQTAPRRAGRPVHVAYSPELGSDAQRAPHSHHTTRRGQMGLRDFQLLAEACQRAGRAKLEANAYYKMGELCSAEREGLPRAVKHFERYLNLSRRLKDVQGEAKALNCLGIVYQEMGGEANLLRALEHHDAHGRVADTAGRFVAFTNIGLVHFIRADWARSKEAHRVAMHYALRSGDKQAEALSLANLGLVGRAQRDHQTAQVCMERHLELAQALQDDEAERDAYEQLGHLLSDKGDFDGADRFFASARQLTGGVGGATSPTAAMQARASKLKCKLGFVRASAAMERHFREISDRMRVKPGAPA